MTRFLSILAGLAVGMAFAMSLQHVPYAVGKLDARHWIQEESIEVQLARAHVKLAKLDLKRAQEVNKQVPGVYSQEFIEKLQLHVAIDEAHLEESLKGEEAEAHQVCIRRAKALLELAQADLNRESAIFDRSPTESHKLNVNRALAVAEIARLNLEQTRHPDSSESIHKHLQSQIDQLRHQVLELQMRR